MLTVETLMQTHPRTVTADMTLTNLERLFLTSGFSGFPVVQKDELIGVVSRSDVVRSLLTERSHAEQISDFYSSTSPDHEETTQESLAATAAQIGIRIAGLHVEDVMSRNIVSIESSESVKRLAALMLDGHLHRLPVVSDGRLVGLVTSMDLVRAIAEGRFVEAEAQAPVQNLIA